MDGTTTFELIMCSCSREEKTIKEDPMRIALSRQKITLTLASLLLLSCALFAGAATAQQGDPAQRIALIDNQIAQWNYYLSDLYRYVKQDPNLSWRYNNDPNYKAQYDVWVNYEWQRGQQTIQQLQWQRGQQAIQQPQPSELERSLFPPSQPTERQPTPRGGGTTSGGGSGGTGPTGCRGGGIDLLDVCGDVAGTAEGVRR